MSARGRCVRALVSDVPWGSRTVERDPYYSRRILDRH